MNDEIANLISELQKQIRIAKTKGLRGHQLADRAEGDVERILRSAYLNLCDYIYDCEKSDQKAYLDKWRSAEAGTAPVVVNEHDDRPTSTISISVGGLDYGFTPDGIAAAIKDIQSAGID